MLELWLPMQCLRTILQKLIRKMQMPLKIRSQKRNL
nr:MAG TPA: hypothetical protein [Caudoviricetes sp.]